MWRLGSEEQIRGNAEIFFQRFNLAERQSALADKKFRNTPFPTQPFREACACQPTLFQHKINHILWSRQVFNGVMRVFISPNQDR